MNVHVTLELTDDQKTRLDDLARLQDAPVETLLMDAVERVLDHDAWFRAEVQKGLDELREGRTVSQEEALAESRARRELLQARKAAR
jgi:predicted transcriptional regulator